MRFNFRKQKKTKNLIVLSNWYYSSVSVGNWDPAVSRWQFVCVLRESGRSEPSAVAVCPSQLIFSLVRVYQNYKDTEWRWTIPGCVHMRCRGIWKWVFIFLANELKASWLKFLWSCTTTIYDFMLSIFDFILRSYYKTKSIIYDSSMNNRYHTSFSIYI